MIKQAGFTLMELIVVIIVVGIIAAAVTFAWPDNRIYVTAQAQQLANDLRYMQNLAVTRDSAVRVNFTANSVSFTETNGTTAINHPGLNTNTVSLSHSTTLSSTNIPNNYIIFNDEGVPYTDISTALASNATVILSGDGRTATITISPQTGLISGPVIAG